MSDQWSAPAPTTFLPPSATEEFTPPIGGTLLATTTSDTYTSTIPPSTSDIGPTSESDTSSQTTTSGSPTSGAPTTTRRPRFNVTRTLSPG
jgi:hypothetical protein